MSKNIALFTAAVSLSAIATAAAAQDAPSDGRYASIAHGPEIEYSWEDGDNGEIIHDGEYGAEAGDRENAHGHHAAHRAGHHRAADPAPRFAYSDYERDEWLAQCRDLRAEYAQPVYYGEEDETDGGLLGGMLGALVGGVAGNRIADGDRLAGTLIGAGVGGIAGAVIGAVIDGSDDGRDSDFAYEEANYTVSDHGFDYCEAYLLNYERGYGYPQQAQIAYAPVMMVPARPAVHRPHTARRMIEERVVADEVEAAEAPAPRTIQRAIPARPQGKNRPL